MDHPFIAKPIVPLIDALGDGGSFESCFEQLQVLGKGAFGKVLKVLQNQTASCDGFTLIIFSCRSKINWMGAIMPLKESG
jgi:hypothetical protein